MGPGTAWILSNATVETTGGLSDYAVQVNEDPGNSPWKIDNSGNLIANTADSVHVQTSCTINNHGSILSRSEIGLAVEFSAAVDPQFMDISLTNFADGRIEGSGDGVYIDLDDLNINGNAGTIINHGTIVGGGFGVQVFGGDTDLTNTGTIIGNGGEGVVLGDILDSNNYTLTNSGTIVSDLISLYTVSFGSGNDGAILKTGTQIINGGIDAGGGTDTLTLDGSGAITWEAYYFENLNKTGSGLWTLGYDLNLSEDAGIGNTSIAAGDFGVNAILTSAVVNVSATGTLSGGGSIIGDIDNSGTGTISPGNGPDDPLGTFTVTGNVTFLGGSTTMAVDIGAQGTGDLLDVGGTATLVGTIQVNEITAIPEGGEVTVIAAVTSLSGTFGPPQLKLGLTSLVVSFSGLYNTKDLKIVTARIPYSNFSATDNQFQVAGALYDSVGLSTGDLGRVLAHLDFLPLQDLQNAFEELQPKPYATHPSLVLQEAGFYRSTLAGRLRDRRHELIDSEPTDGTKPRSNDTPVAKVRFIPGLLDYSADVSKPVSLSAEQSGWNTYAQTYALWAKGKAATSIDGFEAITLGAFFGTDRRIGQSLIGGFCLGTGITDIDTDESGSNGDKLSLRIGPYLSYFRDGFVLEGSVTGSVNWFNNQRSIDITGLSRSAECSYDSYDLAAELAALYELKFWGFTLAPQIRLLYDYIYLDDFQETGADSISLVVSDRSVHSLDHMVGGRLGYDIKSAKSSLRPEAWVGWTHKYLDDEQAVQAELAGAPQNDFTISAPGTPREILQWGAGVTLSLAGAFSSYLHYQAEIYQDTWNHSVRGGFQIQF